MSLKLSILGCHSATPRSFAYPTSQFLEINGDYFLIDCGEGTQLQLRKNKIKFSKIKHIFISHLHGDHFFGLIGLISTFSLLSRDKELHIYAPKGIKKIIEIQLQLTYSWLSYPLKFHELENKESELIFENERVTVHTIPLKHRIYTNGFLFREKPKERRINIEEVRKHPEIETCDYHNLKKGKDYTFSNGDILSNKEVTFDPPKPLSYAFCSDTAYYPDIVTQIKNIDLLYHESTFLEDRAELAKTTKHSTALQAAKIAEMAQVKKLLLGHFSSRYKDEDLFLKEARTIFKEVKLSHEGDVISIENS
ncbi:MAG: ribonuclease Z [Flavobacteriia bacterium]|nr:MAG: ribonuclease Z [Flavobacteriia bacterium]